MGLGQLVVYKQKRETGLLPRTIYKTALRMGQQPKYENWNHKTH